MSSSSPSRKIILPATVASYDAELAILEPAIRKKLEVQDRLVQEQVENAEELGELTTRQEEILEVRAAMIERQEREARVADISTALLAMPAHDQATMVMFGRVEDIVRNPERQRPSDRAARRFEPDSDMGDTIIVQQAVNVPKTRESPPDPDGDFIDEEPSDREVSKGESSEGESSDGEFSHCRSTKRSPEDDREEIRSLRSRQVKRQCR